MKNDLNLLPLYSVVNQVQESDTCISLEIKVRKIWEIKQIPAIHNYESTPYLVVYRWTYTI